MKLVKFVFEFLRFTWKAFSKLFVYSFASPYHYTSYSLITAGESCHQGRPEPHPLMKFSKQLKCG